MTHGVLNLPILCTSPTWFHAQRTHEHMSCVMCQKHTSSYTGAMRLNSFWRDSDSLPGSNAPLGPGSTSKEPSW
eukprot:365942-Chlamydomonas_euryale.AAC.30